MNGWISKVWMIQPMSVPLAAPTSRTSGMTVARGQPCDSTSQAVSMVERATMEPTDRSMPPVRMTKVAPTATTRRNPLSISRFSTTCAERKPS